MEDRGGLDTADWLRLALEAAGMGSFMWYPLEDRTEPDARLLDLFGLPADGSISLEVALARLIHPDDGARYAEAVAAAIDPAGSGRLDEEIRVVLPGEGQRWVRVQGRTVFDGDPPQPARMAGVAIDVTDQRALSESQQALAQRFAYQLQLADALRPLADPADIKLAATRLLATRLRADRAMYADVSDDETEVVVGEGYTAPGVPPITGRFEMAAFGPTLIDEVRAGRTLTMDDAESDPRLVETEREAYRRVRTRAAVSVPLVKDGRLLAVLSVHGCSPRTFDEHEIALVEDTAERTWGAVEIAAAEAALRFSEGRFRSIANASPTIIWTTDASGHATFWNDRWIEYVGSDAASDFLDHVHPDDAERVALAWHASLTSGDDYEVELRLRRHDGAFRWFLSRATAQRDGSEVVQWLGSSTDIEDQKRVEGRLREDEAEERRARERAELLTELFDQLESVESVEDRVSIVLDTLVPRVVPGVIVSVQIDREMLHFERGELDPSLTELDLPLAAMSGHLVLRRRVEFDHAEVRFGHDLAQRVDLLLENARLRYEEQQVAVRLQRALLPSVDAAYPHLAIASRYESASDVVVVGGDWYDAFGLPDGRVGLVVGDVVGHGLDAAVSMGRMRVALAALAMESADPGELLRRLDAFAVGPDGAPLTSATYAVIDPAAGTLTYALAGHPPLLLLHGDGRTEWLDAARSPLLGIDTGARRTASSCSIEDGSVLVLYSDGLIERRGDTLDDGLRRLEEAARGLTELPEWSICDGLINALGVGERREDDVVVMAARFGPAAADRFHRRFPADARELAPLRAELREWLTERGDPAAATDVLLAIGEACTNAVEHAYLGRQRGDVDVVVVQVRRDLHARVRDFGVWRPRRRASAGGRGLAMIETLADDVVHETGNAGTRVSFRIGLAGNHHSAPAG